MFDFSQLKKIHIELTSVCQASCPMCARNHHGGLPNKNLITDEITFSQYKHILNLEVLDKLKHISFCGNFGDPIMSNHLLKIIRYTVEVNPDIEIGIHTNGSARNITWWKNLATILPRKHTVHFGIDGLADTHHLYRIGTNFDRIITNAKSFIDAGGNAEWMFIHFKHNEHQLEEARELANSLGFSKFVHKQTIRFVGKPSFDVLDKNGKIQYQLEAPTQSKISFIKPEQVKEYKKLVSIAEIDCKVNWEKSIYVDALKNLWPCCWLAAIPYIYSTPGSIIHEYQEDTKVSVSNLIQELGGYEFTNLLNHSIKEIVSSSIWQEVWKRHWEEKKLPTCAKNCGKFPSQLLPQPTDQFIQ